MAQNTSEIFDGVSGDLAKSARVRAVVWSQRDVRVRYRTTISVEHSTRSRGAIGNRFTDNRAPINCSAVDRIPHAAFFLFYVHCSCESPTCWYFNYYRTFFLFFFRHYFDTYYVWLEVSRWDRKYENVFNRSIKLPQCFLAQRVGRVIRVHIDWHNLNKTRCGTLYPPTHGRLPGRKCPRTRQ